ncbi:sodium/glutamate symporter [Bartonella sp. DGB1]|uniref:sodium/glutamate symporter n=1 Tax=Bartonella sp. DGB1 TaxID=3239807 RepID=UPI00352552A3
MNLELNSLMTLFLTSICLLLGIFLKEKIKLLQRFCIPSPVVGGFLASLIIWAGRSLDLFTVSFNTSLQSYFMTAFFITVGLEGSFRLIKSGGLILMLYVGIAWFVAIGQSSIGIVLAKLFGEASVLGVMAGSVPLSGGHGGAVAFGNMAVEYTGSDLPLVVALTTATFGLIVGSLLGGPVASYLISRYRIPITTEKVGQNVEKQIEEQMEDSKKEENIFIEPINGIKFPHFLKMFAVILILIIVGEWLNQLLKYIIPSIGFPTYITAMLAAIIMRNLNDKLKLIEFRETSLTLISSFSLGIFLTMAMMSLKIWEIQSVALPLLVIWIAQVAFLLSFTVFIVFRMLGKNYDAAVMCSGLLGHGFGATPTAMANMNSVCERYNLVSLKAFLIVPLTGAVLVEVLQIPYQSWLISILTAVH